MMGSAEGNGPLITRFPAHSTCLRKSDVMRLGWRSTTDQARLRGDEAKVILVTDTSWALDGESRSRGSGGCLSGAPLARWFRGILGQVGEAQPIELAEGIDMVLPSLGSEIGERVA